MSMGRCSTTVRKYEFTWIVVPTLDDAAAAANLEKYVHAIESKGGEVTRKEVLGRRRFAYEIDKKQEGIYLFVKMSCSTDVLAEINRMLKFDEDVLRKLIVLDEDWERRNEEAARRSERQKPSSSEANAPAAS
jgi:small subunit ribosomal protein S6